VLRFRRRHFHRRPHRDRRRRRHPGHQDTRDLHQRAGEIFTPPKFIADAKRLITGYMYDPANIQKVLASEFGAAVNWTLNDSPIRLLITAKGIDTHPWYFVQDNPKNAGTTGKLGLIDCAVASAAAPTYFKPWTIQIGPPPGHPGRRRRRCHRHNPVYQACVEAFYYDTFPPAETKIVSLGTGSFPSDEKTPKGLLGWLNWTVEALLDAPEDQQTELVDRHFPASCNASIGRFPKKSTWPTPARSEPWSPSQQSSRSHGLAGNSELDSARVIIPIRVKEAAIV